MMMAITYNNLSRDFQLEYVAPITLISYKHRILLKASRNYNTCLDKQDDSDYTDPNHCVDCDDFAFVDNYGYCKKCYDVSYDKQQRDKYVIKFIGKIYDVTICVYEKSPTSLSFIIEEIKNKNTLRDISIGTKYQILNISDNQWWNCIADFGKDMRRDFALKVMTIRDFMEFDCWCYVVGLMIKSDMQRDIVFV
jgi:hypothetical protein